MKKLLIAALLLLFITPISFFGQASAFAATAAGAEPAPLAAEAAEATADGGYFLSIPISNLANRRISSDLAPNFLLTSAFKMVEKTVGFQIIFDDFFFEVSKKINAQYHAILGYTEIEFLEDVTISLTQAQFIALQTKPTFKIGIRYDDNLQVLQDKKSVAAVAEMWVDHDFELEYSLTSTVTTIPDDSNSYNKGDVVTNDIGVDTPALDPDDDEESSKFYKWCSKTFGYTYQQVLVFFRNVFLSLGIVFALIVVGFIAKIFAMLFKKR